MPIGKKPIYRGSGPMSGKAEQLRVPICMCSSPGGVPYAGPHRGCRLLTWPSGSVAAPVPPSSVCSSKCSAAFAQTSQASSWNSLSRFYAVRLANPHPERDVPVPALPEVLPGFRVIRSKRRILPATGDLHLRRFALRVRRARKAHDHQTRGTDRCKTFHRRDNLAQPFARLKSNSRQSRVPAPFTS